MSKRNTRHQPAEIRLIEKMGELVQRRREIDDELSRVLRNLRKMSAVSSALLGTVNVQQVSINGRKLVRLVSRLSKCLLYFSG